MTTYIAHLIQYPKQKKRIEFQAENSKMATEYIHNTYPDWEISQFWHEYE